MKDFSKVQEVDLEFETGKSETKLMRNRLQWYHIDTFLASLWPLVPLSAWVLDYVVIVMRAWSLLFNRRLADGTGKNFSSI